MTVTQIINTVGAAAPPQPQGRAKHKRPPSRAPPSLLFLRFSDLQKAGLVNNHHQLGVMVRDHGFPPGRWLSKRCRAWTVTEIEAWVAACPTERPPK
jgi:hypothetical protein